MSRTQAEKDARWRLRRCLRYLRQTGLMVEAKQRAKADHFTARPWQWTQALDQILAEADQAARATITQRDRPRLRKVS